MIDPLSSLLAPAKPGTPLLAVDIGGGDAVPSFAGALTDLLAAGAGVPGPAAALDGRQKPAAGGKAAPVVARDPSIVGPAVAPISPDLVPSDVALSEPGDATVVAETDPAVRDDDPAPQQEPALAWLLPPLPLPPVNIVVPNPVLVAPQPAGVAVDPGAVAKPTVVAPGIDLPSVDPAVGSAPATVVPVVDAPRGEPVAPNVPGPTPVELADAIGVPPPPVISTSARLRGSVARLAPLPLPTTAVVGGHSSGRAAVTVPIEPLRTCAPIIPSTPARVGEVAPAEPAAVVPADPRGTPVIAAAPAARIATPIAPAATPAVDTPVPPADAPPAATASVGERPANAGGVARNDSPVAPNANLPSPVAPARAAFAADSALLRLATESVQSERPRAPRPLAFDTAAQLSGIAVEATPLRTVEATQQPVQTGIDLARDQGLHRMIDRIETLRDAADARDTRIRLIPDALGPVAISVRQDGDTVRVHFTASEATTRQLIVDAQPRLAELADARGVRIERATVDGGATGGQSQTPGQTLGQGTGQGMGQQPGQLQPRLNAFRNRAAASADADPTIDERIA